MGIQDANHCNIKPGRNPLVKWALNGIAKFTSGAYSKYLDKLSEHTGKGAATQVKYE